MYVSRLFTRIIGITEIEKENQQPAAMINNGLSLNKGLLELSFTMKWAVQTEWLHDSSVVQLLETAVQCTLHGAYFEPCCMSKANTCRAKEI